MDIVQKFSPDFRRILNELEFLSVTGEIPNNALEKVNSDYINDLVDIIIKKEYNKIKTWCYENTHIRFSDMMMPLLKALEPKLEGSSIPVLIEILSKTDNDVVICTNELVHILAMFGSIMAECEVKK